MKQLRALALAFLDKADQLLTTEPARLIGYGAAAVIFIVVKVCNDRGIVQFGQVSFEQAVGTAFAAIAMTVTIVESIRRFVYSPQTYIEDLSDQWQEGHDLAHFEEEMMAAMTPVPPQPTTNKAVMASAQTDKVQ